MRAREAEGSLDLEGAVVLELGAEGQRRRGRYRDARPPARRSPLRARGLPLPRRHRPRRPGLRRLPPEEPSGAARPAKRRRLRAAFLALNSRAQRLAKTVLTSRSNEGALCRKMPHGRQRDRPRPEDAFLSGVPPPVARATGALAGLPRGRRFAAGGPVLPGLRDSRVRRRVSKRHAPREQVRGGAPTTFVGCACPALESRCDERPACSRGARNRYRQAALRYLRPSLEGSRRWNTARKHCVRRSHSNRSHGQ